MFLDVTQADIDEARQRRTDSTIDRTKRGHDLQRDCPIACALSRQFDEPWESVRAHPDYLRVGPEPDYYYRGLPKMFTATPAIREYMSKWDNRGSADPHRFRLDDYWKTRRLR